MNGNAAANKIFTLLDRPDMEKGTETQVNGSDILFKNVSFGIFSPPN